MLWRPRGPHLKVNKCPPAAKSSPSNVALITSRPARKKKELEPINRLSSYHHKLGSWLKPPLLNLLTWLPPLFLVLFQMSIEAIHVNWQREANREHQQTNSMKRKKKPIQKANTKKPKQPEENQNRQIPATKIKHNETYE